MKPENLLIDKDMKLKLADFGTSTNEDLSKFKFGTPQYKAPEIHSG